MPQARVGRGCWYVMKPNGFSLPHFSQQHEHEAGGNECVWGLGVLVTVCLCCVFFFVLFFVCFFCLFFFFSFW